ncbi:MAG: DUF2911 domain-containing protein [Saprospiraceae bacterium]|nr:DUF2911 domain-containing protein [Saprospiraceae bacterium]
MKKTMTFTLAIACFLLSAVTMQAQITTPAPSPSSTLIQKVGLTDVEVEYSRPGMKGRTIFAADGLVPFGELWRTGANASTKISFSDEVKFGGVAVPAGKYALYTIPDATEWTIILYKDITHWGTPPEYMESEEAARITVKSFKMDMTYESFTISIGNLSNSGATLGILWENTRVAIPIEVDVDSKVMADIEKAMAGTSARDYYTAASYYYDAKKDMNQALVWIKKANEMDAKFWQLRRESLILAELGRYPEAIAAAEKSKAMAQEAGNQDYVRMNEKSIAEWSAMKGGKPAPGGKKMKEEAKSN